MPSGGLTTRASGLRRRRYAVYGICACGDLMTHGGPRTSDDASWPRRRQCAVYAIYACGELMTHGGTAVYEYGIYACQGLMTRAAGARPRPAQAKGRARHSDRGRAAQTGEPDRATRLRRGPGSASNPERPSGRPRQVPGRQGAREDPGSTQHRLGAQSEWTRARHRPCDQT